RHRREADRPSEPDGVRGGGSGAAARDGGRHADALPRPRDRDHRALRPLDAAGASRRAQSHPDRLAPPEDRGVKDAEHGDRPSYVLGVLVVVYVANFVDRQVLSILNEEIKRDLALSDGEMGFLYGTAFAVFYALFG